MYFIKYAKYFNVFITSYYLCLLSWTPKVMEEDQQASFIILPVQCWTLVGTDWGRGHSCSCPPQWRRRWEQWACAKSRHFPGAAPAPHPPSSPRDPPEDDERVNIIMGCRVYIIIMCDAKNNWKHLAMSAKKFFASSFRVITNVSLFLVVCKSIAVQMH